MKMKSKYFKADNYKKKFQAIILENLSKKIFRIFNHEDSKNILFVVGNQRSGTTMILTQLNKHLRVDAYGDVSDALLHFRLKEFNYIRKIVNQSNAKVIIFKTLEDSHRIIEFLEEFNSSYATWIFRHYYDVVNSCIKKNWGKKYREYITKISKKIYFDYCEPLNLTEKNIKFIQNFYHSKISDETCTALIWYLRNTIYFDYNLYKNPKVLTVSYEKLVTQPENEMSNILKFIQLENRLPAFKGVHRKSIKKDSQPKIDSQVDDACSKLYQKLLLSIKNMNG
jgi:hypothetical protein